MPFEQDATVVAGSLNVGAHRLARKLAIFAPLTPRDLDALTALVPAEQTVGADLDVFAEGTAPGAAFLITDGLLARYRILPDGGRQIITFLIPGDICNTHGFVITTTDHSVSTITPARIAPIPRDRLLALVATRPRIAAALWWSAMQEAAMLRERIVALGRRDARGRVAYLLCEMLWRYRAVGLAVEWTIHLPLTQAELGDALGLTAVHVNRVLGRFRAERLIALRHGTLRLLDLDGLQVIGGITPDYLHLNGAGEELNRYLDAMDRAPVARDRATRR